MTNAAIRPALRSETQRVLDTMTLAFAGDPSFRWWWRPAGEFMEWFPKFALAWGERGFDHDVVQVTKNFEAAAMWLPPGVGPDAEKLAALDRELPGPADEDAEAISEELRVAMESYHPTAPHWYLWLLGVDPRCQGKGHGSALLKHMLARIDAEHATAYLESSTPKNIPLYERHGFEVIGRIQIRDLPPITPMLRKAR
ncbi:MAG TPA: GNAT family N-acetyltransferase [Rhizomicrobium sp.]|jgi:ribosomal protein S18 acetylase RimI-like enzyme|nr:GNAT family N-acetyltransferase [Rhizomicrobium sp.]